VYDCFDYDNYNLKEGTVCVSTCSDNYYESGRVCLSCLLDCKICTTGATCDVCKPTFILRQDKA